MRNRAMLNGTGRAKIWRVPPSCCGAHGNGIASGFAEQAALTRNGETMWTTPAGIACRYARQAKMCLIAFASSCQATMMWPPSTQTWTIEMLQSSSIHNDERESCCGGQPAPIPIAAAACVTTACGNSAFTVHVARDVWLLSSTQHARVGRKDVWTLTARRSSCLAAHRA